MKYSEFHIFSYIVCILLALLLVCCYDAIDEDFYESTSWPTLVLEAKHYIDNYEEEVSLLNLERAYHNDCLKVKNRRKTKYYSDFILDWNSHYIKNEKSGTVLYVPIVQKREQAFTMSFSDGRAKGSTHQVYSALIVRKNNNNNNFVTLIGTYLYGRNIKENDVKNIGIDFESSNFTGYFITSRLDGTMLIGQCFESGKAKFRFRQNPLSPNERTKKTDTDHSHKHQHLFLNLMTNSTILTKSTKSIEGSMYFCSICYKPWDQCTCIEIDEYPLCSTCHAEIIGGLCDCYCYFCFELKSECICGFWNNGGSNNSGGNSSPGGGSGGDSGGGGTSGGNSSNTGNGNESINTPNYQLNPEGLTQSALNAVNAIIEDDNKNNPGKKTAKCNKGVQEAFKNYIGELPSYMINRANEMIEAWKTRPNEWVQIKESDYGNRQEWLNAIQDMANQGYFVVSGWINHETYTDTNGNVIRKSGHVTVIVPSDGSPMGYSGTWSCNVPYTMDTGQNVRTTKQGINMSYKKSIVHEVEFYYYKNI